MKNYSVSDDRYDIAVEEPTTRPSLKPPTSIFAPEISQTFADVRAAAGKKATKNVNVNGEVVSVPYPFPSPTDWRDCWMYFLILDRFANDHFHRMAPGISDTNIGKEARSTALLLSSITYGIWE